MIFNTTIELDGDVAHTETYWQFFGENRVKPNILAIGRYIDRFERRDGRWAIAARVCVSECVNRIEEAVIAPGQRAGHRAHPSTRDRSDISYQRPFGAQTLARSIRATCHGGRISIVGLLTGMPAIGADFFARGLHFGTIHVGRRQHFEQLLRAMQHHATLPVIDRIFHFADTVEALQHLAAHRHFGKVVIRVE